MPGRRKSTIAVTGGAGFIGSHVVAALRAAGHSVIVVDNFSTGLLDNLPERVIVKTGDLTSSQFAHEALARAEAVVHLAAAPNAPRPLDAPDAVVCNNLAATANVLAAAHQLGLRRVVLASCACVYEADTAEVQREDAALHPFMSYALAKLSDEFRTRGCAERYGVDTVCLRIFSVYGSRKELGAPCGGVVGAFCRKLGAGIQPVIYGDGLQTRDFVHVGDVAQACLAAVFCPEPLNGVAINVGTGQPTPILELLRKLDELFGTATLPDFAPARQGEALHMCASVSRAADLLNFRASTCLSDGLATTVASLAASVSEKVGVTAGAGNGIQHRVPDRVLGQGGAPWPW